MTPCFSPDELLRRVRAHTPAMIDFRRALHARPEPRFKEIETARRIREALAEIPSLKIRPPLVETDTVGVLNGHTPGRCVLLRADIDALQIEERTEAAYTSRHPGYSHACGHDGHTAILMGALRVLAELSAHFAGHVLFVFQPAEEEGGGGKQMIERGLLDPSPSPDAAFALHGWPGLPVGCVASRPGPIMAAADRFTLRVTGRGGHGGTPHHTIDPVVVAAQTICALQTIPSRWLNPNHPAVLSVCTIHGGQSSNVIPSEVVMEGTVRYFDPAVRDAIVMHMNRIIAGVGAAANAVITCDYRPGYIATRNDVGQVAFAADVVGAYLGDSAWQLAAEPATSSEDFAYYLERVPGAYLRLGLGTDHAELHQADFDFDDAAIEHGILTLTALALESLAGR